MNVKVFGGAGFIGNHLVKALASRGHHVTVCDLRKPRITGSSVSDPTGEKASWYNPVTSVRCNILSGSDVYWAVDRGDMVINLVHVGLEASDTEPDTAAAVNTAGAANLAVACKHHQAAQLVHISTGAVYSPDAPFPIREETPTDPVSVYGMTKLWGERLVKHVLGDSHVTLTVLRLPHVVGPGRLDGANSIIKDLIDHKRPHIYGDGEQRCDFTYVDDIVQAIILAISKNIPGTYNIGSGNSRSVLELYNWSMRYLDITDNDTTRPLFTPPRPVDHKDFRYDITLAKEKLGYSPKYDLETALEKTIKEWDQWLP